MSDVIESSATEPVAAAMISATTSTIATAQTPAVTPTTNAISGPRVRSDADAARGTADHIAVVWLCRQVIRHRPRDFWVGGALWMLFFTTPAATGYLLGRGYDALANGDVEATAWWAAAIVVSETFRMATVHAGAVVWTRFWVHMLSLLRANMLAAQMASGGPEAGQPVGSAGAAVTHFRDDVEDVANLIDIALDVTGGVVFTAIAGFVLASQDSAAAAILLVPMIAVVAVTRLLDPRIKAYRRADREATEGVTGLLGDVMAAATTVKVNDASATTLARLRILVDRRRHTAVRDRVLEESVYSFSEGAADVGLGLVLLISAGGLASGSFDVGLLALFIAYLGWLNFLPRMLGRLLARRKQAAVAFERMSGLVADLDVSNTVRPRNLPIAEREVRCRPDATRPERVPLRFLEIDGLTATYGVDDPTVGRSGVVDVSFRIERGQFVVLTGPVGAGKSTLLRALLGLATDTTVTGEVRWNGEPVRDHAAFFVPPNAAFLPQVPQLISDSVADNVGLGPVDEKALARALRLAALTDDVRAMPDGSETLIGPRGLRLSGGQRQRLAAARALVHAPELVVLDDVSSAVDVETELALWDNLAATETTVLVVSHRAVAIERADQVLRLVDGRLHQVDHRTPR